MPRPCFTPEERARLLAGAKCFRLTEESCRRLLDELAPNDTPEREPPPQQLSEAHGQALELLRQGCEVRYYTQRGSSCLEVTRNGEPVTNTATARAFRQLVRLGLAEEVPLGMRWARFVLTEAGEG